MDVLDSGTMLSLNDEKHKLEGQLAGVTKLEERLREVNRLLGIWIFAPKVSKFISWRFSGDGESENYAYDDDELEDGGANE